MSARRSRMSLGPGSLPALGNASGRANRRTSFGGSGSGDESNNNVGAEPKKDRRAMLDEWRKSRASNNNSSGGSSSSKHPPKSAPSPSSRPSYSQSSYSNNKTLSPIIASPNVDNNNNSSYSARSQYDDLHNMNAYNNNRNNYEQQQQEQQPVVEKPAYSKPPSSAPSRVVQEKENPAAADDMSGLTALERYRLRKQRQQQQQQAQGGGNSASGGMGTPQKSYGSPSSTNLLNSNNSSSLGGTPTRGGIGRKLPPPLPPSHSGSSHNGEEEDVGAAVGVSTGGYGASSTHNLGGLGTPSRRGKSRGSSAISLGGAQRRVRRRTSLAPSDLQQQQSLSSHNSGGDTGSRKSSKPLLPPSYPGSNERSVDKQDVDEPQQQFELDEAQQLSSIQHPTPNTTALTTTNNFSQESHDSIDSAALKSRLQVMQKRIDNLEREKFELSMSKAPLEARIRQKEDMWLKERERLMSEIENYQSSSKDVDERYRELEMKNEALEEQNSRLRLEARASASSNGMAGGSDSNGGNKDSWGERLKTNNEIKDLRKEVKNKDDEIKSLRIEKVSLESEVFGCQQEIETLERNYDELEKDYQELDSSKSTNIEAEIQLQALTTEHTATTAQLNATCADLEELKTRNKADLQAKEENWKSRESQLLFEMSVLKSRAGKSAENDGDAEDDEAAEMDPAILKARIEERDRRITELEEQLLSGEQLRRALHNRIQELRGNIRVYVRTRPFLPNDGAASRQSSIDFQPDGESLTIQGKHVGEGHAFKFDKVFAPSTGQDMVFDEVSEFVQSALDGYNVCLFSYGQTGKLWTPFSSLSCLSCA